MRKCRLISQASHKIDIGEGDHVLVKGGLSYEAYMILQSEAMKDPLVGTFTFLEKVILGWNFADPEGKAIEYNKELIKDLDVDTVNLIIERVIAHYTPEKKSSQQSDQTSEATKEKE